MEVILIPNILIAMDMDYKMVEMLPLILNFAPANGFASAGSTDCQLQRESQNT